MTAIGLTKLLCLLAAGAHAAYAISRNIKSRVNRKLLFQKPELTKPIDYRKANPRFSRLPSRLTSKRSAVPTRHFFRPSEVLRSCKPFSYRARSPHEKSPIPIKGRLFAGLPSKAEDKQSGFFELLKSAWIHFKDFAGLCDYALESPLVLGHFILVAFVEEIIWRVAAQTILIELLTNLFTPLLGFSASFWAGALGILIVAALFSMSHKHFFENSLLISAEFFGFAILLGVLYYWTSSFILVIVIHALRDIEITFLEYQIRSEEIGNEERAARELEHEVVRETRARKRPKLRDLLIQVPAFYLSCFIGYWEYGVFTRELISPLHIAVGLAAGHLIFGISLLITLHSAETA